MSDEAERQAQAKLHAAIEEVLVEDGTLGDGALLAGWIIVYETAQLDPARQPEAGHFYGPAEMTTWRAMGLTEWCRMTLRAATDEAEE